MHFEMDAKKLGERTRLVLWPALACLSIWLAAGEMPPEIERALILTLWVLAILLLVGLCSMVVWLLGWFGNVNALPTRPVANWLGRIPAFVVTSSRLVLILALLLAGRPFLAGSFAVGFLGLWAGRAHIWKGAVRTND